MAISRGTPSKPAKGVSYKKGGASKTVPRYTRLTGSARKPGGSSINITTPTGENILIEPTSDNRIQKTVSTTQTTPLKQQNNQQDTTTSQAARDLLLLSQSRQSIPQSEGFRRKLDRTIEEKSKQIKDTDLNKEITYDIPGGRATITGTIRQPKTGLETSFRQRDVPLSQDALQKAVFDVTIAKKPTFEIKPEVPKTFPELGFAKAQAIRRKAKQRLTNERLRDNKFSEKAMATGSAFFAGFGTSVYSGLLFGKNIIKEPIKTVSDTGKGIYDFATSSWNEKVMIGQNIGEVIKKEPAYSAGIVSGEIAQAVLITKGLSTARKGTDIVSARLSPNFREVRTLKIRTVKPDFKTGGIKTTEKVTDYISVPSRYGDDTIKIKLAEGFESTKEPLRSQVTLAGKEVTAVSGQRDLFGRFTRKIDVDKPKPKGVTSELETSFFADPRGRLRQSRLGIKKENLPTPKDIISGNVKLRREKPQAIIFEKAKIADFPKNLKDVENALKSGKTLTKSQEKRLLDFQLKPQGEFKPIGFLGKESEITLPKGERFLKTGELGVTLLKGRKVRLIGARVDDGIKITNKAKSTGLDILKRTEPEDIDLVKYLSSSIDDRPLFPRSQSLGVSSRSLRPKFEISTNIAKSSNIDIKSNIISSPKIDSKIAKSPFIESPTSKITTSPYFSPSIISSSLTGYSGTVSSTSIISVPQESPISIISKPPESPISIISKPPKTPIIKTPNIKEFDIPNTNDDKFRKKGKKKPKRKKTKRSLGITPSLFAVETGFFSPARTKAGTVTGLDPRGLPKRLEKLFR